MLVDVSCGGNVPAHPPAPIAESPMKQTVGKRADTRVDVVAIRESMCGTISNFQSGKLAMSSKSRGAFGEELVMSLVPTGSWLDEMTIDFASESSSRLEDTMEHPLPGGGVFMRLPSSTLARCPADAVTASVWAQALRWRRRWYCQ